MSFFRKRGKKWYYTIEIGTGSTRKRIERVGGRTKAEAEKARAAALAEYTVTGSVDKGAKITYRELADEWTKDNLSQRRAKTQEAYNSILKNHLVPIIGDKRIRDIRPRDLQALLNSEAKHVSVSLMRSLHAVLSLTFDFAVFCEYLKDTPMRGVVTPEARPLAERRAFTQEEFKELTAYLERRPEILLPVLISYHTGARKGEVLALTWEDIDFEEKKLRINKTVLHNGTVQDTTKSKSGMRTIAIGERLVKILKAAHAQQAKDRLRYGKFYRDSGRVCRHEDGTAVRPPQMQVVGEYARKHFPPGLCFHSLRHTHATMLLEAGEDLELVSKRLGHASISTTAKVYSHVLAHREQAEREILDRVFV